MIKERGIDDEEERAMMKEMDRDDKGEGRDDKGEEER